MKRTIALLMLALAASVSLFAANSVLTEHFNVVYEDGAERYASLIVENGDAIYEDVCALFGTQPKERRTPIYITLDQTSLNAYYTPYPYEKIVLYDTTMEAPSSIANFTDVMLSIFRHELTHMVTIGLESPFWDKLGDIFGDIYNASYWLYFEPSVTEGLAVYSESLSGGGRNNNPRVSQMLRQAKLEDQFPSFAGATGADDRYTEYSDYYTYGGMFFDYLYDRFGAEKIADLVNKLDGVGRTGSYIFLEVFGITRQQAWTDFMTSIVVPEDTITELNELTTKDATYSFLTRTEDGRIYVITPSSDRICEVDASGTENLFRHLSYDDSLVAKSTDDGTLFMVPAITEYTQAVRVVDEKGHIVHSFRGYRAGCFLGDGYLLLSSEDLVTKLTYFDASYKETDSFILGQEAFTSDFCTCGGKAAFIASESGTNTINIVSYDGGLTIETVHMPEGTKLRSLSYFDEQELIVFSYISDLTFTHIGLLSMPADGTADALFSNDNFSGGIEYPVANGTTVTYIASLYRRQAICTVDFDDLTFTGLKLSTSTRTESSPAPVELESQHFNASFSFPDVTIVPAIAIASSPVRSDIGLGATIMTSSIDEKVYIDAATGYNVFDETFFLGSTLTFTRKDFAAALSLLMDSDFVGSSRIDIAAEANQTFRFGDPGKGLSLDGVCMVIVEDGYFGFLGQAYASYYKLSTTDLDGHQKGYSLSAWINTYGSWNIYGALYIPRFVFYADVDRSEANGGVKYDIWSIEIGKAWEFLFLYFKSIDFSASGSVSYDFAEQRIGYSVEANIELRISPLFGSCVHAVLVPYISASLTNGTFSVDFLFTLES